MHYFSKKHTLFFSLLLSSCVITAMDQTPEQLLQVIQQTPDISYMDTSLLLQKNKGENVFHLACRRGDSNSIKKIFHQKSKHAIEKLLFERDSYGNLGIHRAAEYGHHTTIATLIGIHLKNERYIEDLTLHPGLNDNRPLHFAAMNGHTQAVKVLIHASLLNSDTLEKNLFTRNSYGLTALHYAAANGHAKITKILLKANPAFNVALSCCTYDICGNTPIHVAITEDHANVLNVFIQTLGYNIFYIKNKCNISVADYTKKFNNKNINNLLNSLNLECSLCLDTKSPIDFYTMTNCDKQRPCYSRFCKTCLIELVSTHLNEGSTRELKCPHFNCEKKIHVLDIFNITLDRKDLYNRFLEISFDEFKVDNQNYIKLCPIPDCNCTYSIEEINAGQHIQCRSCNHTYCVTCQYNHDNMTCEHAATLDHDCVSCATRHARNMTCQVAARDRAKIESSLQELQNIQIKPCPHCKVFIEKNQGCNHITCKKCSHEFCWTCLNAFRTTRCNSSWCDVLKVETGINF